MNGNYRRRRWSRIVAAAGLADLVPHGLRHTSATRLVLVDGFGPTELRMFLGHSDARTSIEIYTSLRGDQIPVPSPLRIGR